MTRRTYVEARDSHTDTSDPEACWIWGGRLNEWGYGRSHRGQIAHRRAYIHEHGPIPEGLQIDHLCRNRACVNPAHLEAVTPRENNLRTMPFRTPRPLATHCGRGHEYNARNTYIEPSGRRDCRPCRAICDAARKRDDRG